MENSPKRFIELASEKYTGSLCFFGCWFGRPYDNRHYPVKVQYSDEALIVIFNEGEILEIECPSELIIDDKTVKIENATKVKWSWYSYGRERTPENLLFYEYKKEGNILVSDTNSPWPCKGDIRENAFELHILLAPHTQKINQGNGKIKG